ncbi:putative spermidine/putrescine transport system substrate-binding protein [Bradyrhizobium sp. CIR48]|uniref:ABC transporter substrate-binding protein n=1 Tax=Bradyrhizobium sp. CIR48 TaxID=2663840 RepID=UPI001605ADEF|nr:ABC transporter substrate-binding protein [Bradyrhizobium sp. CIR48]MBB4423877.1 putative spermidine/putrescine transport system substrate-binding protein [Bradyrhizobium sp. CIR48]
MIKITTTAGALAGIALAAAVVGQVMPANAGDQLTITGFGGPGQEIESKVYFEPFTKATGIKIAQDVWNGSELAKVRAMVETRTVTWDVVLAGSQQVALCDEGLLEQIDWKKLGLDRAKFGEGGKADCGVPQAENPQGIIYDKDKLSNGPKTIADLFDLKNFPGKRGLNKTPKTTLEYALIADGVKAEDVYKVLNRPEGVDRAFKKLDTIKKDIVWWVSGAQSRQLLADDQVIMTADWSPQTSADAIRKAGKHVGILWNSAILNTTFWVIPKGDPRLDDAYKFIAFASSPQAQANMVRLSWVNPANKDAIGLVDPAILSGLPTAADNPVQYSPKFWADKGDELNQRFAAWLAK